MAGALLRPTHGPECEALPAFLGGGGCVEELVNNTYIYIYYIHTYIAVYTLTYMHVHIYVKKSAGSCKFPGRDSELASLHVCRLGISSLRAPLMQGPE